MKKQIIILEKVETSYWPKHHKNETILTLWNLFHEGEIFLSNVKEEMVLKNQGTSGNTTKVRLKNGIAYISSIFDDYDEQLELTKDQLIQLIDRWLELIKQNPNEIIMTQDEQGIIALEGIFK